MDRTDLFHGHIGGMDTMARALVVAAAILDDGELDASSDLFGLGVILYELLADRLPFEGKTVAAVLMAIAASGRLTRKMDPQAKCSSR